MKKIFAGVVLPTLAAVAVIGSGFSVWFFGENQTKVSSDASIQVEMLMKIGELTMKTEASTLHLDQTKDVRDFILDPANGYVNPNVDGQSIYDDSAVGKDTDANGLYMEANTKGENAFDGNIVYATSGTDHKTGAWKVEIVTNFKFTGKIKNYVGMKQNAENGAWTKTGDENSVTYTLKWKKGVTAASLPMGKTRDDASALALDFEYLPYEGQFDSVIGKDVKRGSADENEIMKTAQPHTSREYLNMRINLQTGSNLTIETIATIVADTTASV